MGLLRPGRAAAAVPGALEAGTRRVSHGPAGWRRLARQARSGWRRCARTVTRGRTANKPGCLFAKPAAFRGLEPGPPAGALTSAAAIGPRHMHVVALPPIIPRAGPRGASFSFLLAEEGQKGPRGRARRRKSGLCLEVAKDRANWFPSWANMSVCASQMIRPAQRRQSASIATLCGGGCALEEVEKK